VIRFGVPWRKILDAADELDVDLIVMGSHGYGGFDRLLGTTAAQVANRARRNVLVVHGTPQHSGTPGDPYR
jgi:nucleotide-binding universal stress UspA family protein